MAASQLFHRAWNRFARIPRFQKLASVGEDRARELRFWLDAPGRRRASARFAESRTPKEFHAIATEIFGPHQIEAEILGFLQFVAPLEPTAVCEIGTANGGTTFLLGQAVQSVELLVGIDLQVKNRAQLRHFSRPEQQVLLIDGSSTAPQVIDRVRGALGPRQLDVLFIDGDHTYDGVKADFLNFRGLVRDGGVIAFHDIVPDYHTRYGRNTGRWVGDVPRFWSRISPFYPSVEFVENPEQDGLGIGAIRYSAGVSLPEDL